MNVIEICDDMLNNFKGWIVTDVKVGEVQFVSSEDEIFEECSIKLGTEDSINSLKTISSSSNKNPHIDEQNILPSEKYKMVQFFVRDLLECERNDNYFICKGIPFRFVFICGTIVSYFERGSNYWIEVDDGSSSIQCSISKEYMDHFINVSNELCHSESGTRSPFAQATTMVLKSYNHMTDLVPSIQDLKLGNVVKIVGRLNEHNGFRNIFITKINRDPMETSSYYLHLQNLINMYKDVYID